MINQFYVGSLRVVETSKKLFSPKLALGEPLWGSDSARCLTQLAEPKALGWISQVEKAIRKFVSGADKLSELRNFSLSPDNCGV
jgi:hypothetical protein